MTEGAVKKMANDNGWRFVRKHYGGTVLEFKRMADRVMVNVGKRRVITIVYHPRFKARMSGPTELVREDVDEKLLSLIFNYPRIHTDKGKYLKH